MLTASWFTDVVGIYSVFGAFVAGAVMPRGALLDAIRERFEPLVGYLLLPAFFIYSGLNTQLTLILDPSTLLMAGSCSSCPSPRSSVPSDWQRARRA